MAAFVNKLDEALGESMETRSWLDHAMDCKYITLLEHADLDTHWQGIGGMLNNMMNKSEDFCRHAAIIPPPRRR